MKRLYQLCLALTLMACGLHSGAASAGTPEASKASAWNPPESPTGWIQRLEVEHRLLLEKQATQAQLTEAEERVADKFKALIAKEPGHWSLTERDANGNTPLTLAVAGAHLSLVQALLTDASVRVEINQPLPNGATPWILANIAPRATLMACQPVNLSIDRLPLLAPYWDQLRALISDPRKPIFSIPAALIEAGAVPDLGALRSFWRARCPRAPEQGMVELESTNQPLTTLVKQSIAAFKEVAAMAGKPRITATDVSMKTGSGLFPNFVTKASDAATLPAEFDPSHILKRCFRLSEPELPRFLNWSGTIQLEVTAQVEAGFVTGAEVAVEGKAVADNTRIVFSAITIEALRKYLCGGQFAFKRTFIYVID